MYLQEKSNHQDTKNHEGHKMECENVYIYVELVTFVFLRALMVASDNML